jgi:hypothetical protein
MAIMAGTRYDPSIKFRRADGDSTVAMQIVAQLPQYGNNLMIYINGAIEDSKYKVGQNVTYENGPMKVSGEVLAMHDLGGYYMLLVPSDGTITGTKTGGVVYLSPAGSPSVTDPGSSLAENLKTYAPFILLGVLVVGALIWKFRKKK